MRDPLFKVCTRIPLFLGVPLMPMICVSIPIVLVGFWFSQLYLIVLILPLYLYIRIQTARDEQMIFLKTLQWLHFTKFQRNRKANRCHVYAPIQFKKELKR
ncbi:VirB3 family type IV secretion system protein [Photobacterium damselae]|nr:VirB3 family type IV secretion system protein [Photobacterium damselae]